MDNGQKIYDLIHPKLLSGEVVTLDFSGARIFASPFMNVAVGQLLRDIDAETLQRLLIIDQDKITQVGLSILRTVI